MAHDLLDRAVGSRSGFQPMQHCHRLEPETCLLYMFSTSPSCLFLSLQAVHWLAVNSGLRRAKAFSILLMRLGNRSHTEVVLELFLAFDFLSGGRKALSSDSAMMKPRSGRLSTPSSQGMTPMLRRALIDLEFGYKSIQGMVPPFVEH